MLGVVYRTTDAGALINPHKGKFNVTAKGGLVEEEYVDWVISRPYIFLVLLNLVGVA
ncbi:cellulose synthase catalytic subunit [Escherichia coli]|uniref:Cellulose synthase catalytic subunit n=1 Tax=Escherichia coli TaxID=562 RepID=A0A377DAV8_ECOLX|nr:cellulose synthase catalytic subunit [Escherichia coli]